MKLRKILIIFLIINFIFLFGCKKKNKNNPANNEYSIHTTKQDKYLSGDYNLISLYAKGKEELSKPEPVTLTLDESFIGKKLMLSTTESFSLYDTFDVTTSSLDIYNLYINQTYFYKVDDIVKDFKVTDTMIRNIYIDGLTNVRDLGGYNANGKTVKQGLLYRGSKLNDDQSTTALITSKGIDQMNNTLGIRCELDLRLTEGNEQGGITSSLLGEDVKYISFPLTSGGNIITLNKDLYPSLFKILADETNYPLYFHCSIGTDRTGCLAFLINGLLGVEKEYLYKDYLFSNFGNIGSNRTKSAIDTYIKTVDAANGNTLSQKIYNYLVNIGVDKADLDSIKTIMLG